MTSVFFRHDNYIDDISVFHITSTFINISVFQTWHPHWWLQCFQDMTSRLMTSVYFTWHLHLWHQCFRHDIYIDDISVFHISNENHFIYRWMSKTTNPFHNRTVTFLQLYRKWWQYHNWSFYPCELKQEALYVLLICYLPWT
jgi:hypothetical protein